MHQVNLKAIKREKTGKEFCKKSRREGFVPGVIYGKGFENVLVTVDAHELKNILSSPAGTHVIIVLEVDDSEKITEYTTLVSEIQKDVFQKQYYHIDFHKISLNEKVHAEIPVVLKGDSKGVKAGGMMDQLIRIVGVEALPLEMPERLVLDVTELEENQSLRLKDIKLPQGARFLEDLEEMICIIHPPRVMEEETGEEGEAAEGAEAAEAAPAAV